MKPLFHDVRYGIRSLRKSPAFTAGAVLALALGIGGNAAVFSVIYAVLLRPLPYQNPEELFQIFEVNPARGMPRLSVAPPDFLDFQREARTFASIVAFRSTARGWSTGGAPVRLRTLLVSWNYFDVLGVRPLLGRSFLPEEDQPGNHRVAILSHGSWVRRFGAEPGVLGRKITLDRESFEVIGVMPPGVENPIGLDLWTPIALIPKEVAARGYRYLSVLARVKPDIPLEQAQADLSAMAQRLSERYPETHRGWTAILVPYHEQLVGQVRPVLLVLMGAVGFVLLIACSNLAMLMLVRAAGRERELAIRLALGANCPVLVRQMLTESLLLSAAGAAIGLALGFGAVHAMIQWKPRLIPRLGEAPLDSGMIAFTAGLAVLTAVLFGLAPALQAARQNLSETLRESGRGTAGGQQRRLLQSTLAAGEIALAVVLLVGAGLLVRSMYNLLQVDLGFRPEKVLTGYCALPDGRYQKPEQIVGFFREALSRIRELPGVEAAGGVTALPLTPMNMVVPFQIEGRPMVPEAERDGARYDAVTPDYFRAMGIPLLRGRHFTEHDDAASRPVAIVSATMAKLYFPQEDPVGKRIMMKAGAEGWREIVGVVGDVKHQRVEDGARAAIYEPFVQTPLSFLYLVVRAENPERLAGALQAEVQRIDPDQPLDPIRTMEEVVVDGTTRIRLATGLIGGFAVLALLLAGLGIYGVIAYSASQRQAEFGIRMALGAQPGQVRRMIVRQGMALAGAGEAVGIAASLALTRLMGSLLFGVTALDALTYAGVAALVTAVAALACYVPAWRATRIDPMLALRSE